MTAEGEEQREKGCLVSVEELPVGAFELAQSFRALDRLMKTSRLIWDRVRNWTEMNDVSGCEYPGS